MRETERVLFENRHDLPGFAPSYDRAHLASPVAAAGVLKRKEGREKRKNSDLAGTSLSTFRDTRLY